MSERRPRAEAIERRAKHFVIVEAVREYVVEQRVVGGQVVHHALIQLRGRKEGEAGERPGQRDGRLPEEMVPDDPFDLCARFADDDGKMSQVGARGGVQDAVAELGLSEGDQLPRNRGESLPDGS